VHVIRQVGATLEANDTKKGYQLLPISGKVAPVGWIHIKNGHLGCCAYAEAGSDKVLLTHEINKC
jgi:hypothetical protein